MRNLIKELMKVKRESDNRARMRRVQARELRRESIEEIREALRDGGFAVWDGDSAPATGVN